MNIDYIMKLIDWNSNADEQAQGIKAAEMIKNINVFLQPCSDEYNKNVWDNCAIILSSRTDEELAPYMIQLLEWLQDMNWPGALCIFNRLKNFSPLESFNFAFDFCVKQAQLNDDFVWKYNLIGLKKQRSISSV